LVEISALTSVCSYYSWMWYFFKGVQPGERVSFEVYSTSPNKLLSFWIRLLQMTIS